jgi:hypothetical protein
MLVCSGSSDGDGWRITCVQGERVELTGPPRVGAVVTVGGQPGVIESMTSYGMPDLVRYNYTLTDGVSGGFRYQVPPGEHVCIPPDTGVVISSFTCPTCGVMWLASRERTLAVWRPVTPV